MYPSHTSQQLCHLEVRPEQKSLPMQPNLSLRQLLLQPSTLLRQVLLLTPSAQPSAEAAQLTSACTFRYCMWCQHKNVPNRHAVCTAVQAANLCLHL